MCEHLNTKSIKGSQLLYSLRQRPQYWHNCYHYRFSLVDRGAFPFHSPDFNPSHILHPPFITVVRSVLSYVLIDLFDSLFLTPTFLDQLWLSGLIPPFAHLLRVCMLSVSALLLGDMPLSNLDKFLSALRVPRQYWFSEPLVDFLMSLRVKQDCNDEIHMYLHPSRRLQKHFACVSARWCGVSGYYVWSEFIRQELSDKDYVDWYAYSYAYYRPHGVKHESVEVNELIIAMLSHGPSGCSKWLEPTESGWFIWLGKITSLSGGENLLGLTT